MGKEVAVKAAHALYLMRNSKYHDLIVSEEGSVRLKHDGEVILDVESIEKANDIIANTILNAPEDSSSKIKMPGFVKEVQEIADGGVRWVYADWHARDCGIESACYDRFGRAIPDPDKKEEDDGKGKKSGGRESEKEKSRENDSLLVDVSKKLTKVTNMLMEQRTDEMLAIQGLLDPKGETLPKERSVEAVSAILDSIDAQSSRNSLLVPAEYKDELDEMEEEFAMPDFSSAIENGFEAINEGNLEESQEENFPSAHDQREAMMNADDSVETFGYEADPENADLEEQTGEEEYTAVESPEEDVTHAVPEFYCTDKERFLSLTASRFDFAEAFLESLLSNKGKGHVFLDFENKVALVEKNYIGKTAMSLIEKERQRDFEIDFLKKDAAHIFDGALISDMLRSVSIEFDIFHTFGKGKRSIYNLLIEVEDVSGLFINGWFAKIDFKSYDGIDRFIKQCSHGASIKIITSNPKDIGKRSKLIENVKWIY